MLDGVTDPSANTAEVTYDFKDDAAHNASGEYEYDNNGNMTRDGNKGITVQYNALNLPKTITWDDGRRIELLYTASGSKLHMATYNASGVLTDQRDYVNGFEYNIGATPALQQFPMSEGRVVPGGTGFMYEYSLKDHLGNTRVTFKEVDGVAEVQQKNFYYPFGLTVLLDISGEKNHYAYNGKELVENNGLDWYDYGARWYDPQLGRWHVMDPVDEYHNPYNYVGNNPVNLFDYNGMWDDVFIKGDQAQSAFTELQGSTSLSLTMDANTGKLLASGNALTDYDKTLFTAINDENINVNLIATSSNSFTSIDGSSYPLIIGAFDGNQLIDNKIETYQYINMTQTIKAQSITGPPGLNVMHEVLESYFGGQTKIMPNVCTFDEVYAYSHSRVNNILTLPPVKMAVFQDPISGLDSGLGVISTIDGAKIKLIK